MGAVSPLFQQHGPHTAAATSSREQEGSDSSVSPSRGSCRRLGLPAAPGALLRLGCSLRLCLHSLLLGLCLRRLEHVDLRAANRQDECVVSRGAGNSIEVGMREAGSNHHT